MSLSAPVNISNIISISGTNQFPADPLATQYIPVRFTDGNNFYSLTSSVGNPTSGNSITGSIVLSEAPQVIQGTNPWIISGSDWIPKITGSISLSSAITGAVGLTGPITGTVAIASAVTVNQSSNPWIITGSIGLIAPITGNVGLTGPITGSVKISEAIVITNTFFQANQGTAASISNPWFTSIVSGSDVVGTITHPFYVTGTVGITSAITGSIGLSGPITGSVKITELVQVTGTIALSSPITGSVGITTPISIGNTVTITGSVSLANAPQTAVVGIAHTASIISVTEGTLSQWFSDIIGRQIVAPYANPENTIHGRIALNASGSTPTQIIPTAGAGMRNYITSISITGRTVIGPILAEIYDGANLAFQFILPQTGSMYHHFPMPYRGSVNTPLSGNINVAGVAYFSIDGFKSI